MSKKQRSLSLATPDRWDGTAEGKTRLHKEVQAIFRDVARILGLSKGEYEVSSNMAGPASGGEVRLHADGFHLWANFGYRGDWGPSPHDGGWMTARRVAHRRDYVGAGENVELAWELLWDPGKLVEVLRLEGVANGLVKDEGGKENVHDCI